MKCKKCLKYRKTNYNSGAKCWDEYGLCVKCAKIIHPELYSKTYTIPTSEEMIKINTQYNMCECGCRLHRLYHQNLGNKRIGAYYCMMCQEIQVYNKKITMKYIDM